MNLPLLHTPIRRAVLLAALAAGLFQTSFLLARQEVGQRPRLILVLAIDQMRFDYLTRFDDLYAGGLRTLIDNGAVFTNARYRHAATETGPGHSVILSGRHPSSSGIVANAWYDGLLGRTVNVVADPFESPLGGPGASASPVNFVGFTLGDALKQSTPESRVVGVSQKDRSAILMAGRLGDGAYWYETSGGNFITSTYYMDVSPAWLDEWNGRNVADRYARRPWDRLIEDEAVYQRYAGPDAIDGEWDRQDTVFPTRSGEILQNRVFTATSRGRPSLTNSHWKWRWKRVRRMTSVRTGSPTSWRWVFQEPILSVIPTAPGVRK